MKNWDPIKEKDRWTKYFENSKLKPIDRIRTRLEIYINNKEKTHIGWVNYYDIDQYYKYTKDDENCAVGIGIPEQKHRGNGYGLSAIITYIDYLKSSGITEIYTKTQSGNIPMIHLANKIGFRECNRFIDLREIDGKKYDAITFYLR